MESELRNEEHREKPRVRKSIKRLKSYMISAVIGCLIGVFFCVAKPFSKGWGIGTIIANADTVVTDKDTLLTISTVEEILRPASDLISMRYCYTDADMNENFKSFLGNRVPFTTDKVVFTYDGVISVGIDLASVKYEIDHESKAINIELPEVKIIANEIDASSFKYAYKSDSIFNSTDMSDYTSLIDALKQKKAEDVKNNTEFMQSAETNTKTVVKSFLTEAEATKEYTVNFKG
ncbi:MAG: DUF4230 domain-containing protein [bacterium]|nr:DUF4230 domain-containing protein [bacterium]